MGVVEAVVGVVVSVVGVVVAVVGAVVAVVGVILAVVGVAVCDAGVAVSVKGVTVAGVGVDVVIAVGCVTVFVVVGGVSVVGETLAAVLGGVVVLAVVDELTVVDAFAFVVKRPPPSAGSGRLLLSTAYENMFMDSFPKRTRRSNRSQIEQMYRLTRCGSTSTDQLLSSKWNCRYSRFWV